MEAIKLTIEKEISLQSIADLLCTAFEGGSNYWYKIVGKIKPEALEFRTDPKHIYWYLDYPLNKGGELTITARNEEDFEDFQDKTYKLNLESIEGGLRVMQEKYPSHFRDFMDDNADSITGDVFLQCCLFGEVIFG